MKIHNKYAPPDATTSGAPRAPRAALRSPPAPPPPSPRARRPRARGAPSRARRPTVENLNPQSQQQPPSQAGSSSDAQPAVASAVGVIHRGSRDHCSSELADPPASLCVPSLYPYQSAALSWLLHREGVSTAKAAPQPQREPQEPQWDTRTPQQKFKNEAETNTICGRGAGTRALEK